MHTSTKIKLDHPIQIIEIDQNFDVIFWSSVQDHHDCTLKSISEHDPLKFKSFRLRSHKQKDKTNEHEFKSFNSKEFQKVI